MITNGEIHSKIDAKQKMISFIDDQKSTAQIEQSAEYMSVIDELE